MSAPPKINKGKSTTRLPMFNEKYYSWWKVRIEDFLTADDYELWTIVNQGPLILTKQNAQNEIVPKDPSKFVAADFRMMEKNAKAKKILICVLGPDEYNRIYVWSNTKHIWDALQTTHEGTNQVKRSGIELLLRNYEHFSMKGFEPIQNMMTRFAIITNELKSLGKVFTSEELVSKVLRILQASWESKVTTIKEAKEFDKISLDELVGNLKTYEMRKMELHKEEPKEDKALVLKASKDDESDYDDPDLPIFAKFKRFVKNSKSASKREASNKPKQIDKANYDGCYKCDKLDHMVKYFPMWEIERIKERAEKEKREKIRENGSNKGKILGKGFTEEMKQAFLAAYEDNGSNQEEEKEDEAISLYAVIDEQQAVKTEPPDTEFDPWVIFSHGPTLPTKLDSKGNRCNKREEEYDEEDHQLVQKNAKAK
ncbi:uncharacterized protein [Nicotiana tomentosiformis]|uniref:uncharacterized protein n=1 Tax=Nicotiana tomentosiformis TaxID=4098 RepID=UPI00051ABCEE|nr:uncharacterized protein LOC104109147 [Nicotiana tomentosiformis]